jgi:hypothetical protein
MQPLDPQPSFKVYALIKQTGLTLTYVYASSPSNTAFGLGFYATREEAEQHRTLELLKDTSKTAHEVHVFELEIPNPAYKK